MNSHFTKNTAPLRLAACFALLSTLPVHAQGKGPVLEEVAAFPEQQVTGVTVSKDGRVFVNFPFWDEKHTISVAELAKDGSPKPYPDETWNQKQGDAAKRWVCVQSVVADDAGSLWVVDAGAPLMEAVVKGGAKLVKIDLATNAPVQTIAFDEAVLPERSYLNDVRIDTKSGHAYLTESSLGALLVVDLKSGKVRRLLADHPSTKAEPNVELTVDGIQPKDPKTGKTPIFQADGMALDAPGGYLYWHALTGYTLWRAKTEDLRNEELTPEQLGAKVEKVATTAAPDGMLEGRDGTVYLAAFEKNAVVRFDAKSRKETIVVQDERLQWPDTMSWGQDGWLYVTTSQIHRMPKYNYGVDKREGRPFRVLRVKLP